MKAHRKQVVGVLAIALIACFYILAVHAMQRLEEEMQFVSFVQTTEGGIPVQEYQEEKQYEIAGVIEHKENLFVYEPKEGETATFQRVVTKVKEDEYESMRVLEETLQMKFGSGKVLDYTWLKMILDLYLLMIPECWSDFEFWTDYVSYQRENLERLIQMRKTLLDMRLVRAMRQIVFCNMAAILLFCGNSCYTKRQRKQERI